MRKLSFNFCHQFIYTAQQQQQQQFVLLLFCVVFVESERRFALCSLVHAYICAKAAAHTCNIENNNDYNYNKNNFQ